MWSLSRSTGSCPIVRDVPAVEQPRPTQYRWTPAPNPRSAAAPNHRHGDVASWLIGLGMGATVALGVRAESLSALHAAGGAATAAGRLTGLVGTYLLMVLVLLVSRLPALERSIGHDKLVRMHRRIAPAALLLLVAHGILITVGYAQAANRGPLREFAVILQTLPGMVMATAGMALLLAAGVTSYRYVKRRMKHETWWIVHLYTYLAVALAFSHQIATGSMFVNHPVARAWWIALLLGTAGVALVYRVLVPLWRSVYHNLRVVGVYEEIPGVVSIILKGRRVERLAVNGGQFFQWRFLRRGLWWQAHPYSISAMPLPPYLRVTVKDLGDHSRSLSRLATGTRVAIEGPYGAFTRHASDGRKLLLVGAGVGVTPIRAMLEDLPWDADVEVIVRASTPQELVLDGEIEALVTARNGRLHRLIGDRGQVDIRAGALRGMIHDLHERDVYVCGPEGFTRRFIAAARRAGVTPSRIHREEFAF
jgi:predicted ferric reductase